MQGVGSRRDFVPNGREASDRDPDDVVRQWDEVVDYGEPEPHLNEAHHQIPTGRLHGDGPSHAAFVENSLGAQTVRHPLRRDDEGLPIEISGVEAFSSIEPVTGRDDDHLTHVAQEARVESACVMTEHADSDVRPRFLDRERGVGTVHRQQTEREWPLLRALERGSQQIHEGPRPGGEDDRPALAFPVDLGQHVLGQGGHLTSVRSEQPARLGEREVATLANVERCPDLVGELPDLRVERRLRDEELVGRVGEIAVSSEDGERHERIVVHA